MSGSGVRREELGRLKETEEGGWRKARGWPQTSRLGTKAEHRHR